MQKLFIYTMMFFHFLIFSLPIFVILLSDSLPVLITMDLFFVITLILNYYYGDCPITQIEQHYGDKTMIDTANKLFPIKYNKKNRNVVTLQWIFMAILVATTKILLLFIKSSLKKYICK
jgi:hypothetical protein